MTNDERSPKSEARMPKGLFLRASSLGLRHSFVIRHSSFVISCGLLLQDLLGLLLGQVRDLVLVLLGQRLDLVLAGVALVLGHLLALLRGVEVLVRVAAD